MKMRGIRPMSDRLASRKARVRSRRPEAEALEDRMLLYAPIGQWTYSSRITYSFMPDGTSIGGTPSVLFQTMNSIAPTATWQNQIEQAATPWESNANVNLALVSDSGATDGTNGDQQDDPRFGDIRIGAMPLPSGTLAETFLPPASNGGTIAGDIVFNSTIPWQIGAGFDLESVALHEFGHALGLGDQSTDSTSAMYYAYNGLKTTLSSDDTAGIQSLYGAVKPDQFGGKNYSVLFAPNITSYIDGNGQINLSGLENTSGGTSEWYAVTVPATTSGQMVVTVQSSNLSSFAPGLYVFSSSLTQLASVTAPTTYGATLTTTLSVTAGQKYYIKVMYGGGMYGRAGAYGLQLNFGTQGQPPIAPPNTVVLQQPDAGSGSTSNAITPLTGTGPRSGSNVGGTQVRPGVKWTTVGNLAGWADTYSTLAAMTGPVSGPPSPVAGPVSGTPSPVTAPPIPSPKIVGPIASLPVVAPAPVTANPPGGPTDDPQPATLPTPDLSTTAPHHRHHRRVHQAVDATLSTWAGHRKRPQAIARVRSAIL
jgi:hypothetical protein